MPIKDQCEKCRFYKEDECTQFTPAYDGSICHSFEHKPIDLIKTQEHNTPASVMPATLNEPEIQAEEQPSDEDIHGWLQFFLYVVLPFNALLIFVEGIKEYSADPDGWVLCFQFGLGALFSVIAILTIKAFHRRDTDAVFLAKTFVVSVFVINVFALCIADSADFSGEDIFELVKGLIWCVIWFSFLCCSEQVKRLIPKSSRKTRTRDWVVIAAFVLVPLMLFGAYIGTMKSSRAETEAAAIANLDLAPNQHTDGRIVLTLPYGYDCEEEMSDNIKLFIVSDPQSGAIFTIVSDYDDDATQKNFNYYWNSWEEECTAGNSYEVIMDNSVPINDNLTLFYKAVRLDLENPTDWEFALLFDIKSGKVCLISCYSAAEEYSPMNYLINNIEFL